MANAIDSRLSYPSLLAFIVFGIALGIAMFLLEGIFGIELASWLKAVVLGVGIVVFIFVYGRMRKASES